MLNCKDCDYYRAIPEKDFGEDLSACDLSDMLFLSDVEDLDIEYPCRNISYNDYLQKKAVASRNAAAGRELADPDLFGKLIDCSVCMLRFPDGTIEKCFGQPDKESAPNLISMRK